MIAGFGGIAGVIAARVIGPYERGLLATAVVWSTVAGSLSAYGLPQASTYFMAREPARRAEYAGTMLRLVMLTGALLALVGVSVSLGVVRGPASLPLAIAFAGQLPNLLAGWALGAILGLGEYQRWGRFRVLAPALNLIGVVTVLALGWRTAAAVVTVNGVVLFFPAGVLLVRLQHQGLIGRPSRELLRPVTSYMRGNIVSGAAWLISLRLDQLFLSVAVAPRSLGLYAVAASFGEVMLPIAASPGYVMLSRVSAGGPAAVRSALPKALGLCIALAVTIAVFTFFVSPLAVRILFGARYQGALPSLRVLLPGACALAVNSVLADTLRGLGRPLLPARAEIAGASMTIVLLSVLVPALGIVGAAISSTVAYSTVTVFMVRNLRRALREAPMQLGPSLADT